VSSNKTWRTKSGKEIPFQELSDSHLRQIARLMTQAPKGFRGSSAIRRELLRRGLDKHLRPSYPNL
jgi:hypothetical protein